ncbi:MAG: putative glycosyltransferase [Bryobacterales bacterium]|nr:putative glycosyltransferase [Bryobacterales bacterium]
MKQADPNTAHLLCPRARPARLSLVLPVYDEQAVIAPLRAAVNDFARALPGELELVLVNDGSSDQTLALLAEWAASDARVRVLHLSRNFGHQIAATAGLDYATGDAVVLLDADLQDPLVVIHRMIDRYCQGYDVVYGQRESRAGESAYKRFTAWAFYRIMRSLVYRRLPPDVGDFRLISRQCLNAVGEMRETHRFLRGMVAWVGFPQVAVAYHRQPRVAGSTKYPLRKMLAFSWIAATSFSTLPLRLSMIMGALVGMIGIEEGIRALLAYSLGWYTVPGWTSLTVLVSLIGSALLMSIGILGEYVAKLYEQSKGRPLYIVARTFGTCSNAERSDAAANLK